jgi:putative inorganic carbon (HCO3(-)) transporter
MESRLNQFGDSRRQNAIFWLLCILFVLANTYALVHDLKWVTSIPFVLGAFLLVFFHLEKALLFLSFLVPLSVNFEDVGFGLGISLPDEPLIILIMFLSLFKIFIKSEYDLAVFRHPITIIILANLLWMLITCFTSQMPLVSFKFFMSRLWYVVVFYFMAIMLFKKRSNIKAFYWLHILSLTFVIAYTMYNHANLGFTREASYLVMQPFYIAHGIYAAAIAFCIPILVIWVLRWQQLFKLSRVYWLFAAVLLYLFCTGLLYSYTRAAWISVFVLPALALPMLLRIKLNTLIILCLVSASIFLAFKHEIYYLLSKNDDVSSTDISVHLKSVTNVKSDASNAERINRWMSAIEMYKERPVIGFGPGTYMFLYGPYQQSNYWTIISTNHGDIGNAHSEYLGTLSESGLLGLLTLLGMIYMFFLTGFRLFYTANRPFVKWYAMAIVLGLSTYLVHAVMNNYMESDKIAMLWWSSMALLVSLDLYHNNVES